MNETVKQGKYFIGDPISVLPEKYSIGIWGNEYNYLNGKFNINGFDMVIHTTHNGDGIYKDTRERSYKTDSGTIGLIHTDLLKSDLNIKNGYVFDFTSSVNFIYDAGLIYIKSDKKFISIDTRNMEEYDSDYETHYENENGEPITKTITGDSDDDLIDEYHNDDSDSDNDSEKETETENKNISVSENIPITRLTRSFFKKR